MASSNDDMIRQLSDCVRRALQCPVCMELSCSISMCCQNGHGTCDNCYYKMLESDENCTPKCPVCRSEFARPDTARQLPSPTVRKLYELMSVTKVACAFRPNGCPKLMYVPTVSEHESVCRYSSLVRCLVSGCRWTGAYDDVFRHVSEEHRFSAYDVLSNRFFMPDLSFGLRGTARRVYLIRNVRDKNRLYWIGVARPTESSTQIVVLEVIDPSAASQSLSASPGTTFRVKTVNPDGWYQFRGQPRPVSWDRAMLARLAEEMEDGVSRSMTESALHLPESHITSVHNDEQYDAIITWSA